MRASARMRAKNDDVLNSTSTCRTRRRAALSGRPLSELVRASSAAEVVCACACVRLMRAVCCALLLAAFVVLCAESLM